MDGGVGTRRAIESDMPSFVPILESLLTCPHCGHQQLETMPTDACQWYYECPHCHTLLKPKPGDCCVYCSYGSVPCPPVQESGKSCCG
jgi:hypothetical protein